MIGSSKFKHNAIVLYAADELRKIILNILLETFILLVISSSIIEGFFLFVLKATCFTLGIMAC